MVTRRGELKVEGFILALLGFGISRFAVAESLLAEGTLPFVLIGIVPLVLGLGLAVAGVVLAVGTYPKSYVRTVTVWAYAGTGAMTVVIGLTVIATVIPGGADGPGVNSGLLVANVLLGGALGGVIIGDRVSAYASSRREIERQVDRAILINRILRHEILNAATIVQGYAALVDDQPDDDAVGSIREAGSRIESTVHEIADLAEDVDSHVLDLGTVIRDEVEKLGSDHVEYHVREQAYVRADGRLHTVVRELIENALIHGTPEDDADRNVRVEVDVDEGMTTLSVSNDDARLPERQRILLESGTLQEYDDPRSGFGLQTVRLLVEYYDGTIGVEDEGRTVSISLPRVRADGGQMFGIRVRSRNLLGVGVAAIIAGVVMGVYMDVAADLLPVIGALYAVPNQAVGWLTHIFHSIVFGLLFAAALSRPRLRERRSWGMFLVAGMVWGIVLWFVAAGVIMPIWLQFVGVETPIPNLVLEGLVSHVLWGAILGLVYRGTIALDPSG